MNTQAQGSYTRILPWAALALMVVFFFWQVAKRNEVVAALHSSQERVQELEAGHALMPAGVTTAEPRTVAELSRLGGDLAAARARADAAEAAANDLAAKLEQAEAVRATEAARATALAADRDAAQGTAAALRMQLEEARRGVTARLAALRSERDMAQGMLAAIRVQLEETGQQLTAAGEETWLREQERDYARGQAAKLEAQARTSAAEATALRRALADVQTQVERLLRQAEENQARIATLKARGGAPAAPRAYVDRWLALATGDTKDAGHPAALREAWMAETPEGRAAKADAYVAVLNTFPSSEEWTATARRLTTIGMLPDDVLARSVGRLATTHLSDYYSWMTFLLRGGPAVRAVILQRLKTRAPDWSAESRASFGRALVGQLGSADASRRRDAAWGIGALGHRGGQTRLVRLLEDDDGKVRHAAAWTLTRMPRDPSTVEPLKKHAKALLDSPKLADLGEGIWLAQWVLGQPQNMQWVDLSDAQLRRVARRLRPRLDG